MTNADTLRRAAVAFLRGAADETGGALAETFAREVLRDAEDAPAEWVRLALDVRDGDALWGPKAARLAGMVLDDVEQAAAAPRRSAG